MKIRAKIILVVLPLIIVSLCLAETASYLSARQGVTRAAHRFLGFKAAELKKYTENQWDLLAENNYDARPDMIAAAREAAASYARSILLSDTELIFALDNRGNLAMSTSPVAISVEEGERLAALAEEAEDELLTAEIGGVRRVFRHFYSLPFQWRLFLTEEESVFYADVEKITLQTIITLALSLSASALLLALFARQLTGPLERMIAAMKGIIAGNDLSGRVQVEYRDETGRLAATFNAMLGELEKAYGRIKGQAFEAALAQKKEERIRRIFQKYVPRDLIEKFFASPESMLVGDNRNLAILFSDIRGFTTISEGLAPDELVKSLNRYFSGQVDIIMNRGGIVDKYIGDAIMAFWGAPVNHGDDPLRSVLAALDMLDAVEVFNKTQRESGKTEFRIGIGLSYGTVTVGNIGSERKMDYTVIGDMVNLASRMEGLTKPYHAAILVSESLYGEILRMDGAAGGERAAGSSGDESSGAGPSATLSFRLLDTVAVKGKTRGVKIYTVRRRLDENKEQPWIIHNEGMERYYRRDFTGAASRFEEVLSLLPEDFNAQSLLDRCRTYAASPPPENWDGVEVMTSK